jgi:hypothetical protein
MDHEQKAGAVALKPKAVPIKVALHLLGDKSRSQFYVEAADGEYDLFKDGAKTLVGLESIERHNKKLPRAKIGKREVFAA